jgi:hypothetical protein
LNSPWQVLCLINYPMLTTDTYMSPGALIQVMTQVRYPRRRRLRKGGKLCLNQIGTSFGVTITTIVFDKIVAQYSKRLGYTSTTFDTTAPPAAQISGYRAAQWTAFGFAVLCEYSKLTRAKTLLILSISCTSWGDLPERGRSHWSL